jgi:hypothetical protein
MSDALKPGPSTSWKRIDLPSTWVMMRAMSLKESPPGSCTQRRRFGPMLPVGVVTSDYRVSLRRI